MRACMLKWLNDVGDDWSMITELLENCYFVVQVVLIYTFDVACSPKNFKCPSDCLDFWDFCKIEIILTWKAGNISKIFTKLQRNGHIFGLVNIICF